MTWHRLLMAVVSVGAATAVLAQYGELPKPVQAQLSQVEFDPRAAVLVEVFTSEGDEEVLEAIEGVCALQRSAQTHHQPVVVLAFHTSRRDPTGWTDRLARDSNDVRFQWYLQHHQPGNDWVPQVVVNGRTLLPGPPLESTSRAVEQELTRPALGRIPLTVVRGENGLVSVTPKLDGRFDARHAVHVALVQGELVSEVSRGWNVGRTLIHRRVVRDWAARGVSESGPMTLRAPADAADAQLYVAVWVQDLNSREVLAVSEVTLPRAPSGRGVEFENEHWRPGRRPRAGSSTSGPPPAPR